MFKGIDDGYNLIRKSIKVFNRHPKFIIPLLYTWLIYASVILYLGYFFHWENYTFGGIFFINLGVIFLFAFLLSFSCSILLENIQQLESGKSISLRKSFYHTLRYNIIKIIPLVIVWTIIWFIILIIQIIIATLFHRREEERKIFTLKNAAKTLAGYQKFSFLRVSFYALKKGIRMVIFLILPCIAWENFSLPMAVKKGITIFRIHFSEFITGFTLTWFAAIIIFLPPSMLFVLSDESGVIFPDIVWIITIIYISIAWSYSIYLEQMFAAELYLWHMKWEEQIKKEKMSGSPLSKIKDIKKPSILDEVSELLEK
ncbi:hypothetical protein KAW43_03815 [Candidatus Parcubacteria bacterium]|nr:hypothetical protein [Candidatus Parcubacteria bacterium]